MNATQAIKLVRKVRGQTFVSVQMETVKYSSDKDSEEASIKYTLSIQPALNGDKCQIFYGSSVQECCEKFQAGIIALMEAPVEVECADDCQCNHDDNGERYNSLTVDYVK
jgi:hypothetical protein